FQAPSAILSDLPEEGFTWIAAGDVNKDGWTDLLATQPFDGTGALYVMLNNKQGGFSLTTITENAGPDAVTLADVNGDGNLDAIVMEEFSYSAHVYLGNGNGGFKSIQDGIPYPFVDPLPAQVADVNGDGILDLLLAANGSIGI